MSKNSEESWLKRKIAQRHPDSEKFKARLAEIERLRAFNAEKHKRIEEERNRAAASEVDWMRGNPLRYRDHVKSLAKEAGFICDTNWMNVERNSIHVILSKGKLPLSEYVPESSLFWDRIANEKRKAATAREAVSKTVAIWGSASNKNRKIQPSQRKPQTKRGKRKK